MNKPGIIALTVLMLVFISGCASLKPVPLDTGFWQEKGKRVGVAFLNIPPAGVQLNSTPLSMGMHPGPSVLGGTWWDNPGYSGWPMIVSESRTLRSASSHQDAGEFMAVEGLFVQGLKDRGFEAFRVEQGIHEGSLPRFKGDGPDAVYACKDFRDIGRAAHADYLIVLGLDNYGTMCRYIDLNNYDAEVYVHARGFMVDAASNRVLWRTGAFVGHLRRTVDALCSRPDHTPVILGELNALLKEAARVITRDFFEAGQP